MNRDKYRKLSQQQAEANRRNGLTHGLSGDKYFILEGEDPEAFLRLLQDLHDHPSPVGDGEDLVVQRIAAAQWRLDLCISMGEKESSPADPHDPDDLLARAFMLKAARSAQCPAVPEAPHAPEAPAPEPPNPANASGFNELQTEPRSRRISPIFPHSARTRHSPGAPNDNDGGRAIQPAAGSPAGLAA